jgi:hypothetical protein
MVARNFHSHIKPAAGPRGKVPRGFTRNALPSLKVGFWSEGRDAFFVTWTLDNPG